jgi:hypothetical protein
MRPRGEWLPELKATFVVQSPSPGAYTLDTQTGEVFQVVGKKAPEYTGSIARPRPKQE